MDNSNYEIYHKLYLSLFENTAEKSCISDNSYRKNLCNIYNVNFLKF